MRDGRKRYVMYFFENESKLTINQLKSDGLAQ